MSPTKDYRMVVSWSAVKASQIDDLNRYGGEGICDGDSKSFILKIDE